jgi:hypothetical protein
VSDGFVCPPLDIGLTSIKYRMHGFLRADDTVLSVGVVDLVAIGLLVGCVHAASPARLRALRQWAIGIAVAATLPFVSAVAVLGQRELSQLTQAEWAPKLFDAYLLRNMVCGLIILVLGAIAAGPPVVVAALATCRLRFAAEQQDLELRQLRGWVTVGGAPVAAQFALATWATMTGNWGWAVTHVWTSENFEAQLPGAIVGIFILLALPAIGVAAIVLPLRAATRSMHLRQPPNYALTPARFVDCVRSP